MGGSRIPRRTDRVPVLCECRDHGFVSLSKGYVTLVDPQDMERTGHYGWCAKKYGKNLVYARKGRPPYALHTYLMGRTGIDHINGNPLDNRRRNLRDATPLQNAWNAAAIKGVSKFKGVDYKRNTNLWRARIRHKGQRIELGYYKSEIEAARAYRIAATRLRGEFARY